MKMRERITMNWVDVLVILLAVLAAISGARQGVVIALPSLIGVLLGAIAGVRLAPFIVALFDSPVAKVAFAVATAVFLIAIGEILGGVNAVMPEAAQGLSNELRKLLLDRSGAPSIVDPFQRQPINQIGPPDASLQTSPV